MPSIPVAPKFIGRRVAFNIIEDALNPTAYLPPLYMQYNPNTMNFNYQKIITRYQTFTAHVEEHWGEELDNLTGGGSTGGFILEDFGLTTQYRTNTLPYFKFQDLLDVYRNNGNIYDSDGRIVRKGSILLSYDEGTYFGYFDNFNYTEDANNPFRFTFDFSFKIQNDYVGI